MDDSYIHQQYHRLAKPPRLTYDRIAEHRETLTSANARWNSPSFRSQYFNVCEGLQTLASGETKVLAQKVVPQRLAGVLRAFTQDFADCNDLIYSITWGIRVYGLRPVDFADFVGELSKPYAPCDVFYTLFSSNSPLVSASPGSGPPVENPTVQLLATNNAGRNVTIQGRLIGYTFSEDEIIDEFMSY